MPISGLVITLKDDETLAEAALAALAGDARVTLAPRWGHRQPVALETGSREEDKALWAWVTGLPGVAFVDVVFVHFEDAESESAAGDTPRDKAAVHSCPD